MVAGGTAEQHVAHAPGVSAGEAVVEGLAQFVEVRRAVALEGWPLLVFSVGVLDADALRGLLMAGRVPGCDVFGWGALLRFERRGLDLVGELLGKSALARVDLGPDLGILLEQVADSLGLHCCLVAHSAGRKAPAHKAVGLRPSTTTPHEATHPPWRHWSS